MLVFSLQKKCNDYLLKQRENGLKIGFVPTMGALHSGHISLIEKAREENDIVACSVFVNPTQFNNKEDLEKYPVTTRADLKILKEAKCDVAFFPTYNEVYTKQGLTEYDFGPLDKVMEAANRPGHFKGVANVVSRLFDIIIPHNSYFGQKDYQQLLIIKELVKQEKKDINIVGCPIIREESGLAMSSRNARLSEKARKDAAFIYGQLKQCKQQYQNLSMKELTEQTTTAFTNHPILELEYFEIANAHTLLPIKDKEGEPAIACIAAWCEGVRLIDNLILNG